MVTAGRKAACDLWGQLWGQLGKAVRQNSICFVVFLQHFGRPSATTFQRPDIALAFFTPARNPSVGAGFAFRAKRQPPPGTLFFEGFSPSVLSVLCFCESRLSHVAYKNQWVARDSLTRHLAGGGDRSAAERISAVQARLRRRPSRNPGRTRAPRFRTSRAASLPRPRRAGSPPSASRRPACGIAA